MADPLDAPQWKRMYAFCGQCWERKRVWAKGNIGYCLDCRPDWQPTGPGNRANRRFHEHRRGVTMKRSVGPCARPSSGERGASVVVEVPTKATQPTEQSDGDD